MLILVAKINKPHPIYIQYKNWLTVQRLNLIEIMTHKSSFNIFIQFMESLSIVDITLVEELSKSKQRNSIEQTSIPFIRIRRNSFSFLRIPIPRNCLKITGFITETKFTEIIPRRLSLLLAPESSPQKYKTQSTKKQ